MLDGETIRKLREAGDYFGRERIYETGLISYTTENPIYRWLLGLRLRTIIRVMPKGREKKVLDFGCGTGILIKEISGSYSSVVGLDQDIEIADRFLKSFGVENVKLVSSLEELNPRKLPSGGFDVIVCSQVLEHIPSGGLDFTLDSLIGLLVEDGSLVVTLPLENLLYRLGRLFVGYSGHYHRSPWRLITEKILSKDVVLAGEMAIPPLLPLYKLFVYRKKSSYS